MCFVFWMLNPTLRLGHAHLCSHPCCALSIFWFRQPTAATPDWFHFRVVLVDPSPRGLSGTSDQVARKVSRANSISSGTHTGPGEHPSVGLPREAHLIFTSVISNPGPAKNTSFFSVCAYALTELRYLLPTCDESRSCRSRAPARAPFRLKNRPAETGRREAAWRSTLSRHLPPPPRPSPPQPTSPLSSPPHPSFLPPIPNEYPASVLQKVH